MNSEKKLTASTGCQPEGIIAAAHNAPPIKELHQYSQRSRRGSPFEMRL
jgi:hypothetical protein